ncbi:MAG: DUF1540 domain-containing protein [Firmicutes bacterium]|nr:DUF1540 domain-containing protein [Bacillota bacterium]
MSKCNINSHIICHVDTCKFHCNGDDHCSLESIRVGTHEKNPTGTQCTDCQSFQLK